MPRYGSERHKAAFVLLVAGTLLLFGAQQALSGVVVAHTEAVAEVPNLQPLPEANPPLDASQMDTATENGEFEERVKPTPVATLAPTVVPAAADTSDRQPGDKPMLFESGIASTYGESDGFEGNRTACGQVFHTSVIQIAHKTLPCGTHVRVEDTRSGRTVDARVTDRGPYVPGRVVDLSWGAFKQLDPTGPGLLPVKVYVLDR